jgi:hypothetical protein
MFNHHHFGSLELSRHHWQLDLHYWYWQLQHLPEPKQQHFPSILLFKLQH